MKSIMKREMRVKKFLLLLSLIIFMAIYSNGSIFYRTQTRLFISELEQEIPNKDTTTLRPFVVIPNRLLDNLEQQDFLRYFLNFKDIILKQETKELKWKPQYRNDKAIFPRLVQVINIEGKKFEIALFPLSNDVSLGFRIQISMIKSLTEENTNMLPEIQAIYNATSEGNILDTEINNFGYDFYVLFPAGKKMYILSFCTMSGIVNSIR